jgi:hypothetical protein
VGLETEGEGVAIPIVSVVNERRILFKRRTRTRKRKRKRKRRRRRKEEGDSFYLLFLLLFHRPFLLLSYLHQFPPKRFLLLRH